MHERNYAIIGTGAIGGLYGARLQKAGIDVHFLLRSDYEYVSQHGLIVESIEGDIILPQVNAYKNISEMPKCDVAVLAIKSTQNPALLPQLKQLLKDNGIVLVLQNGIGIEEEVAQIVGADRVMGGLCFVCANKIGFGHIRHLDYGAISLGEYAPNYRPCGITERMHQIGADFEKGGTPIQLAEDLMLARWKKLVWNIPYNGLSVVLNARTDELMADAHTRLLVEKLMREVVAGAAACERYIPDSFIQKMLDDTVKMKPYRTSMKIDFDEGRPLEVEAIFGNTLRLAQQAGIQLPQIAMLYHQLKFLDAQNRRKQENQLKIS
ncbi:MAG: putative 2-dehydropantoate 2-reductase [Oscillatoriaceae bacterium SKW80]|nr:putative 2-dehydropantoate 2-reductase [Oscillatoriaceae bacterium SKYG93]MCX8119796.1 putative 2-dehydropantoate 2-reductase [Oscillatoriaceae bacterium SKW80]MDW8452100.1 putative 2-dehydropantoate 2-reductase [Oscillatoriaceae cyanobacterium SKYGB_i_bin93]HIK27463.1 putative 2-dehydropantoate 2-reductase [Oscillatoriaceae cyanobacterium M7585_C2015_266]